MSATATQNERGLAPLERRLHRRTLVRTGAGVAAATLVCVLAIAVTCRLLFAEQAREWLAFGFDPPPSGLLMALEILIHNAQLASLCFAGAVLGQLGQALGPRLASRRMLFYRAVVALCGFVIGLVYVANVILVGVSLGAYGPRMLRAILPHAPVELFGFSLALAVYMVARERAIGLGSVIRAGVAVVGLLALAAVLETWGAG